jgi:hypothetical protein
VSALASVAPSDVNGDGPPRISNCHLRAFSGHQTFGNFTAREFLFLDTTLLAVVRLEIKAANSGNDGAYGKMARSWKETGFLPSVKGGRRTDQFQVRLISPEFFDVEFARSCLNPVEGTAARLAPYKILSLCPFSESSTAKDEPPSSLRQIVNTWCSHTSGERQLQAALLRTTLLLRLLSTPASTVRVRSFQTVLKFLQLESSLPLS